MKPGMDYRGWYIGAILAALCIGFRITCRGRGRNLIVKAVLLIPDGVGVRNFLCTGFLEQLLDQGEVVVWHALHEELMAPYRARWHDDRVRWQALPAYRETLLARFFRQAKLYAQLYWKPQECATAAVLRVQMRNRPRHLGQRAFNALVRCLARACGHHAGTVWLDHLHTRAVLRSGATAAFSAFLRQCQPDILFCAHQRASRAVPAMLAAQGLGIPAVTFIYSWDNLAKGRMAVHADHYLVWSDYMKAEMAAFYPEIAPERVHVTGTPQFEPYFNDTLFQTREEFFAEHCLDPARPVVCFSGDDVTTSPNDPQYLADLAEALRAWPTRSATRSAPQILFRCCPVDRSGRYAGVLARYPEIRVSEPRWEQAPGDWTQIVPTQADVALLANIAKHSDLVVNLGSTMAMDFAIFDKPGIFLAYDPAGAAMPNVEYIYRLPHFASVHRLQPVYWVRSPHDLRETVLHALRHRAEKQAARRQWLETHALHPLNAASRRCVEALCRIADTNMRSK